MVPLQFFLLGVYYYFFGLVLLAVRNNLCQVCCIVYVAIAVSQTVNTLSKQRAGEGSPRNIIMI